MILSLNLLYKWHDSVECPTEKIDVGVFRDIVNVCSGTPSKNGGAPKMCSDMSDMAILICEKLLVHIKNGLNLIDAQPLCALSMCNLINYLPNTFHILFIQEIHDIFIEYLESNDDFSSTSIESGEIKNYDCLLGKSCILALINGIFQSHLICNDMSSDNPQYQKLSKITINKSLEIVIRSCMKYTRNAYSAFKNLALIIEKLTEWNIPESELGNLYASIIYVTIYNWENLLPGIKELNCKVMKKFLRYSNNYYDILITSTTRMPWCKAKYYILSELAISHKKTELSEDFYIMCVFGLRYSLKNSVMVSAGKDLYKILLHSIEKYETWSRLFLKTFLASLICEDPTVRLNCLKYWLGLTLKRFPEMRILILEYLKENMNEKSLLSYLFVIKLGRKNGQLLYDWNMEDEESKFMKSMVNKGLVYRDSEVRSQAFEIVCCTSKNTKLPTAKEFEIVKVFLQNNIKDDCTPFRQSILNSFTMLLIRNSDAYLHHETRNSEEKLIKIFKEFQSFCVWLCKFLTKNLSVNGNYQRKICSLKLFEIVLKYYSIKSDFNNYRKTIMRYERCKITEFLKNSRKWLFEDDESASALLNCFYDPTNDVRELASNILIKYFISYPFLTRRKNEFFINALVFCNSKFFYEVESGVLLLKLLFSFPEKLTKKDIAILVDHTGNCDIDILEYLTNKVHEDLIHHSRDPFYSICNNQQLYGMILAINTYIKYTTDKLFFTNVLRVINIVCDTTFYLLNTLAISCSEKGENYPPSFHEMNESIDFVIAASQHKIEDDQIKDFQITNAQQLVLNNIWLNLKACSELSSTIIEHCYGMLYCDDIESCINVNMSILTKCRHKGAIEYAGLHLGRAVKYITTNGNAIHRELLSKLLEDVITDAISPTAGGASITRKSAGLTILVHRFVTNDSQIPKPFFIVAVLNLAKNLLSQVIDQNCPFNSDDNIDSSNSSSTDEEVNIKDSPQAIAIHLLCRTVVDCSLSQYIIQFASILSTICFEYFYNENWAVRNAALQLYGALIPKLVGQKTKDDNDILSESTISIDELFSHVPNLGKLTLRIFEGNLHYEGQEQSFNFQSSLIPVLSLFASTSKRYGFENTSLLNSHIYVLNDGDLFFYLVNLLHSPLFAIRNSVAKAIELFYSVRYFNEHCKTIDFLKMGTNGLHGYLLVLNNHMKHYNCMKMYTAKIENKKHFSTLMSLLQLVSTHGGKTFIQHSLFLEMMWDLKDGDFEVDYPHLLQHIAQFWKEALESRDKLDMSIGLHSWVNVNVYYALTQCKLEELGKITILCVEIFDFPTMKEIILPPFLKRLHKDVISNPSTIEKIFENFALLPHITVDIGFSKMIFEIFYKLLENAPTEVLAVYDKVFNIYMLTLKFSSKLRKHSYLLPSACLVVSKLYIAGMAPLFKPLLELTDFICKLAETNDYDIELKMMLITSLHHLATMVTFFSDTNSIAIYTIKSNVLTSVFWLLQDENVHVRNECSNIMFGDQDILISPNHKFNQIFSLRSLVQMFNGNLDLIIKFLNSLIDKLPDVELQISSDVPNPFDHQIKNIYLEPKVVKDMLSELIQRLK